MAMRWRFSERPFKAVALLALAACVSTVTRYYLPDAHNPRFDVAGATQVLDQYLRVQCPDRLAAKKPVSGGVRVAILADTAGAGPGGRCLLSSGG